MSKKLKGDLMLVLTAMVWGGSFVAQKSGMELIGPFAFNGIRTIIGGIVLIPLIMVLDRMKSKKQASATAVKADAADSVLSEADKKNEQKLLITGSICCGLALLVAGMLQQIGMMYTTAGKAGFITALYVVLVPIFGRILGKKIRPLIWLCVLASAFGLYLLCMPASGGFGHINKGDLIVLACALCFAVHILLIDYFSPKVDGVRLSCLQFFIAGILCVILMFPLDPVLGYDIPSLSQLLDAWIPIVYAGALSCGAGYTMQIVAQADTDPAVASMILCLESVFALIAGMLILGESLSLREASGCIIMFAAILAAQLPAKPCIELAAKKQS
ncbi:MAG: DMT family transporter [Clostridiales bacterium]|nr:DMT family transporter [Clostridiales bacterium]